MKKESASQYGTEVYVRLSALERDWGRPREDILAEALYQCQGVQSRLNEVLKNWMYPTPDTLHRKVARLINEEGWSVRRQADA